MITLKTEFVSGVGGFSQNPLTYKQIARTDKAAVYLRSRNETPMEYEVFRIFIKPKGARVFQKVYDDDTEEYPSSGKFGFSAWSITDKGRAMERYKELCAKADEIKDIEIKDDSAEGEEETKNIPTASVVGEFSTDEYSKSNGISYPNAYLAIKAGIENGTIKYVRSERRNARGKETKLFVKVEGISVNTDIISIPKEVKEKKPEVVIELPENEFTVNDFAVSKGMPYVNAYLAVKAGLANGTIKFLRKEKIGTGRGKPSSIYSKV